MRIILVAFCLWLSGSAKGGAAELVMFEEAGCEWCDLWNQQVGIVYSKTPEGRRAPLRNVNINDPRPDDLMNVTGIVYTPTFVVVDNGVELGRIVGYLGEDFFWGYLDNILSKAAPATLAQERPEEIKAVTPEPSHEN